MKPKPTAELLHNTPLWIAAQAIRQCHNSHDKSDSKPHKVDYAIDSPEDYHLDGTITCGPKDAALIQRVGCKMKHESTLEHLNLTFSIYNISRAVLQELARHRHMSLTVKSSRFTLNELKGEAFISTGDISANSIAAKYIHLTGNANVGIYSVMALANLQELVKANIANDISKYALSECYLTSLTLTINVRSLRNLLT